MPRKFKNRCDNFNACNLAGGNEGFAGINFFYFEFNYILILKLY